MYNMNILGDAGEQMEIKLKKCLILGNKWAKRPS